MFKGSGSESRAHAASTMIANDRRRLLEQAIAIIYAHCAKHDCMMHNLTWCSLLQCLYKECAVTCVRVRGSAMCDVLLCMCTRAGTFFILQKEQPLCLISVWQWTTYIHVRHCAPFVLEVFSQLGLPKGFLHNVSSDHETDSILHELCKLLFVCGLLLLVFHHVRLVQKC